MELVKRSFFVNKLFFERVIEGVIWLFGLVSIIVTFLVILTLVKESIPFFMHVNPFAFLFGTQWVPTESAGKFGVLPLLVGTAIIVVIASVIALPLGLGAAIFISEYASRKVRAWVKPILEILAGIPSVIYGFFALKYITPLLKELLPATNIFNALSGAIAVGIMVIPTVASLSEDSLKAVPDALREAGYGLGMTKAETVIGVVVPAAFSGVVSAFILGISRAIGETMIVAIATGATPILTFNPLDSVQTMTGYIVNRVQGEVVVGSLEYQTIYAVALLLFLITLCFNLIAKRIAKKFANKYE